MKKSKRKYFIIPAAIIVVLFLLSLFLVPKAPMTGEIVSVVTPDYIELQWKNDNIISQKVGTATECTTAEGPQQVGQLETECNWEYQELSAQENSFRDYDIETKLKFYQVISKVQVGQGGSEFCQPVCEPSCGMLQVFGWVDSCTEECLKVESCTPGDVGFCCLIDSDSQGWYSTNCDQLGDGPTGSITDYLIKYDGNCQYSSQICDQKSDILVKFSQELEVPIMRDAGETSINWLVATKDVTVVPGSPTESATELLKTQVVDYVAYWNPSHQQYYGAAFGTAPSGMQVVTGPFELEQYHPYFVGAKTNVKITWAGPLPEWQTFELKFVEEYLGKPTDSENFIVLPFDTSIKMASQLCDSQISGIPIEPSSTINWWDPTTQKEVMSEDECSVIINYPETDFELELGKVYKIIVDADASWKQK